MAAMLEGIGILFLVPFLEIFAGASASKIAQIANGFMQSIGLVSPKTQLIAALAWFLLLLCLRSLIIWARDTTLISLSMGFVDHCRHQIFKTMIIAPWSLVSTLRHTDIQHALTDDISRIALGTDRVLRGGTSLIMLSSQLVIAFILSPKLTGMVLVFVAIASLAILPLVRQARQLGENLTHAGQDVHWVLGQFLTGLKLAKSHAREKQYLDQFDKKIDDMRVQTVTFAREQVKTRLIFLTLSGLLACLIIVVGVFLFSTPMPILIVILFILARISGPFLALQQDIQIFFNMLPAFQSFKNLLQNLDDENSDIKPSKLSIANKPSGFKSRQGFCVPPTIKFDNVCFGYNPAKNHILNNVSFILNPGEVISLEGISGVGKTTVIDLLVGLLIPTSGKITIDGKALEGALIGEWRRAIACVTQDPFLFDTCLRENLKWANPDCSEEDIWDTLELVGADGFVKKLPKLLDHHVGDRGSLLSGGERQRICLARALLGQPKLLILDEATNAMDIKLEHDIMQSLVKSPRQMTILMVSHRSSINNQATKTIRLPASDEPANIGVSDIGDVE